MTITIKNKAPSWLEEISLNDVELKSVLTYDEYRILLDEDSQLEKWAVLEEFGTRFVIDKTWLEIYVDNKLTLEIKAHEILNSVFYSPENFEGIESEVIDNTFIAVTACVAQGQGGGFAIIDVKQKKWIVSNKDFFMCNFTFLPKHEVFVSFSAISTYAWCSNELLMIKKLGEMAIIQLHSKDHFSQTETNDLERLGFVENIVKLNEKFFYSPQEDRIYFSFDNEYFMCDFTKLINLTDFQL